MSRDNAYQYNLFDKDRYEKYAKLDRAVDEVRRKYGEGALMRGVFLNSRLPHMSGGLDKVKRTGVTKALAPVFREGIGDEEPL